MSKFNDIYKIFKDKGILKIKYNKLFFKDNFSKIGKKKYLT
jgi:hypothetical protein